MEDRTNVMGTLEALVQIIEDAYKTLNAENRLKNLVIAARQNDNGELLQALLRIEAELQKKKESK